MIGSQLTGKKLWYRVVEMERRGWIWDILREYQQHLTWLDLVTWETEDKEDLKTTILDDR